MKQSQKETRKQTNRETKKARMPENLKSYRKQGHHRPTKVLHLDIKTDPYKSARPKITRFENATKTHNLDTKWPKTGWPDFSSSMVS